MIFDLTDDDRQALEAHRIRLGLRSHAEALRSLIRGEGPALAMAEPPVPRPSFSLGRSKTVLAPAKRERTVPDTHVAVPTFQRKAFNPQPKGGKR
jgi:hypothetical protein